MIQLNMDQLSLSYGKQAIVNNISFAIKKGSIIGLVGPNGAGKSSILKVLAGLVYPDTGHLKFNENIIDFDTLKSHAGFHIDSPSFYPFLSASDNLRILIRMNKLKTKPQELLDKVGLSKAGRKKVKHFSTGMKQRLAIAQTLLRSPDLLFLDEPFNGLDPNGFQDLIRLLRQLNSEGITIIVSSHLLNELEQLANHFILLNNGQIALDITKKQLQESNNTVQLEFETSIDENVIKLLEKFKIKQLTSTAIEVRIPNDEVAFLVKSLVEENYVPTQVNTMTLLQQKYLEITA
jgi:ABC-2 type transport system ATP-binding protein